MRAIAIQTVAAAIACAVLVAGCGQPSPAPVPVPVPVPELPPDPPFTWALPAGDDFAAAPTPTASGEVELVVLHTNDLHGQVYPQKALWLGRDPAPDAGGLSALASIIRRERAAAAAAGKPFLLLDAGDIWAGTPEGTLTEGRVMASWMNLVGYDALAIGNHEFDAGADRVEPLARLCRFPWLAANLVRQATGKVPEFARPSIDRVAGGLKVTIVGLTHPGTREMSSPKATRGFEFADAVGAAAAEAKAARERGAEVVLLLSHCGLDIDKRLAGAVPGVDAVIGGHSHVGVDPAWTHPKTKVLVAATFSKGSTVGRATLSYDRKTRRVARKEGRLIQVLTAEWPRDPATDALVARDVGRIEREMAAVLGSVEGGDLRRAPGHASSALGNWIADIMRERAGADVAIHNKTGIRADLPGGSVRLREVYQVSPYGNTLASVLLSGRELRAVLENALAEPRHAVEVSGAEVRYDLERPPGDRVIRLRVGGAPVDPERLYRVATNSVLAKGGEGFVQFARAAERRDLDDDLMRLHADDIRRRGRVRLGPAEPRLAPAETTMPVAGSGG